MIHGFEKTPKLVLFYILALLYVSILIFYYFDLSDRIKLMYDSSLRLRFQSSNSSSENLAKRFSRNKYDVDCRKVFESDKSEMLRVKLMLEKLRKEKNSLARLPDSNFIFGKEMCSTFKSLRGYDKYESESGEIDFPLAYIILVYNEIEQFERLLKAIYREQNIYCIHVDNKSSHEFKQGIKSIADCFDNVFVATKLENVVYASVNRLLADINCMRDLTRQDRNDSNLVGKRIVNWKYLLNMASTEFPLRTNYELTRILRMYNGSNVIEINKHMTWEHYVHSYTFQSDSEYPVESGYYKTSPPYNFTILRCSAYNAFHRDFVDYVLNSRYAIDLLDWANDTYSPDEWYANLNLAVLFTLIIYYCHKRVVKLFLF
jgi:hypothetical protein